MSTPDKEARDGRVRSSIFSASLSRRTLSARGLGATALGVALLSQLASPSSAEASGFAVARFGGEHGHPTTTNPTAIYYNPAGIVRAEGKVINVFADVGMAYRFVSYDRPVGESTNPMLSEGVAPGANDGHASLKNFIVAPFLGATTNFKTDWISFGAALYFPFGGQARWDRNDAYPQDGAYPGANNGQQRWFAIDGTIRSMYITGALAFHIKKAGLSLGLSGSAIRSEADTIRARNGDGSDDLVDQGGLLKEGRSAINVSGWQGGFGIGAMWEWKKMLWIGASYTSQPNVAGGMTLKGKMNQVLGLSTPDEQQVIFTQQLPDIIRLGFRVRPHKQWEIRAFADYTRWSVFNGQCLMQAKPVDGNPPNCSFNGLKDGLDNPAGVTDASTANGIVQYLPRYWKDAGGVRLGASFWPIKKIETFLGVGYDSSAVPVQTLEPALIDMNKMSLSAGARFQIVKQLAIAVNTTQIFYFKVDTKGQNQLNDYGGSARQPSGNGVYRQFISLMNLYFDVSF